MAEGEKRCDVCPIIHRKCDKTCAVSAGRHFIFLTFCCVLLLSAIPVTEGTGKVAGNVQRVNSNNGNVKNTPAELYVLSEEEANKTGAYCLDGSPPAYYFRKGSGDGKNSWIVWLQGGGACVNLTDCYRRSFTHLGSTKGLGHTKTFSGILSAEKDINPDFYTWNAVTLAYCDGLFFAGDRRDVVKHNGRSLYFRGRRNLNALIDMLVQTGMGEADRIILGGSSAGAIATYWGADDVIGRVPTAVGVKIIPDSGMFINIPDKDGVYSFNDTYTEAEELHNAALSTNKECLNQYENWVCHFPENLVPFEPAPTFILNYLYDRVALKDVVKTTCRPDTCEGKDLTAVQNYRKALLKVAQTDLRKQDGAFLITCFEHGLHNNDPWTKYKVNNKSVRQAVGDWYFGRTTDNVHVDMGTDLNPTCRQDLGSAADSEGIWD